MDDLELLRRHALIPDDWMGFRPAYQSRRAKALLRDWRSQAAAGELSAAQMLLRLGIQPSRPAARGKGGKPRLALLGPCMGKGGAERCLVDLAAHIDHRLIGVSGFAVRDRQFADAAMVARAEAIAPVVWGTDAAAWLIAQSDILIFWGMPWYAKEVAPDALVYVSHGAGGWAVSVRPDVDADPRIRLVAVSRWAASVFERRDVRILHNAVDGDRLRQHVGRDAQRQSWGVQPDEIVIGYVGRISQEKNCPAAAQAARALGKPYRAVYVGPDYLGLRCPLQGEFPEAIFVGATEAVGDVYAAVDVFMLASPSEGFSLALAEAWWLGLPVVTTRVGAVPELERQYGEIVAIVPVGATPEQLADGVRRALSPDHRPVIERAQRMARRHCTMAAYGRRWTEFLLEVFNASRDAATRRVDRQT